MAILLMWSIISCYYTNPTLHMQFNSSNVNVLDMLVTGQTYSDSTMEPPSLDTDISEMYGSNLNILLHGRQMTA